MKIWGLLWMIFLMGILLFACSPKISSMEKSAAPEPLAQETEIVGKKTLGTEWGKTLSEARKEGKVVLYTTTGPEVRKALTEGFFNRTGIALDTITGRGPEIITKLLAERINNLFLADVYLGGTTPMLTSLKPASVLAPLKPILFLPEVVDLNLWYKNTLPWLDNDQTILQVRMMPGGSQADAAFLTGSINKAELTSWYDLLKPQFKGRMNLQDPTIMGKGSKWVNKALTYYGLDWDYMKALAKQEPFVTRDQRLQIEWVVRSRHLLAVNPDHDTGDEYIAAGAPLGYAIFKETKDILGGGSSGVSLIDRAYHPKAAKLFINWFLSKEGQTAYARSYRAQSARMDTPTDHLMQSKIRQPGVDYPVETEEFVLKEEKLRPQIIEIFSPLLK